MRSGDHPGQLGVEAIDDRLRIGAAARDGEKQLAPDERHLPICSFWADSFG